MRALFINMFLPIKLGYVMRYTLGMLLFSLKLPRKSGYWAKALGWIMLELVVAAAMPIFTSHWIYITLIFLVEALMSMCVVKLCCNADWSLVFYIASAVYSAEHIASMLDSIFTWLWPEKLAYSVTETLNVYVLLNWVAFLAIVYAAVYAMMFRGKRITGEHGLQFNAMLMLLVVSLIVNVYMNLMYSSMVESKSLFINVFECIFNLLCSALLLVAQAGVMRESQMQKRLEMVSMLWEQAREQYRVSKENIEAINIKCHDLKHLLLAVKDKTDAGEYAHLMELVDSYGAEIKTGNEVLDVVFQEKNFQCRKLGIQFTCIIDGSALNFIETTDLYVLFGNLIDNCIEAVSRLPETEVKNIQVTVRRDRGFVIVTTENGYAGELKWADGRLRTSKRDAKNHGFGLLSIEKIIHRYGGRYSVTTDDQIFTMNIVFPLSAGAGSAGS